MFAGYLFLRFKDGREIRQIKISQTLMNLQYNTRIFIMKEKSVLSSDSGSSVQSTLYVWKDSWTKDNINFRKRYIKSGISA